MRKSLLAVVAVVCVAIGGAWAQGEKAKPEEKKAEPTFQYVGVKSCKMCHKSKKSGNQHGVWLKGPHAGAYATLATEESAEIAKKLGIEVPPQEAAECLSCHATAYGLKKEQIAKAALKLEHGVQCESCHGPGSAYKKLTVMKNHEKAVAAGLWETTEEMCVKCHNKQSPTYKVFDFEKKSAMIAHLKPCEKAEGEKKSE